VIDTLRPVSLPEGTEITLRLAGPLTRARAWLIDFSLRLILLASLPPVFMAFGKAGMGMGLIVSFAIMLLYPVVFEALWQGATPGKRVCNLAVVHADGTPIGWSAAFLRNVVRIADALPIGYVVGLVSMLLDPQFRRLGDLAAGTVVIHRDALDLRRKAQIQASPVEPRVALTALEQRAIIDFAERRRNWSDERAAELAAIAAPVVGARSGDEAAQRLENVAAWLMTRR
jgi:uncharacterized RDD family membrane protein YckC